MSAFGRSPPLRSFGATVVTAPAPGRACRPASLDCRMDQLRYTDGGPIDLSVGVEAHEGKEPSFLGTVRDNGGAVCLPLYAPERPYLDRRRPALPPDPRNAGTRWRGKMKSRGPAAASELERA